MYWKITWPPLIYTSAQKIVPVVVLVFSTDFVNQSSERPVRSESLKFWIIHLNQKKYCYFVFDSQLTGLIQNKTKYCNINAWCMYTRVYSYNQWNYFQRGCMDKWWSSDFSIQTRCIPFEAFASKNNLILQYFVHFESVWSIMNQRKSYNTFTVWNVFFKLSLLIGLPELWLYFLISFLSYIHFNKDIYKYIVVVVK